MYIDTNADRILSCLPWLLFMVGLLAWAAKSRSK